MSTIIPPEDAERTDLTLVEEEVDDQFEDELRRELIRAGLLDG